jgi:hypothetical protein
VSWCCIVAWGSCRVISWKPTAIILLAMPCHARPSPPSHGIHVPFRRRRSVSLWVEPADLPAGTFETILRELSTQRAVGNQPPKFDLSPAAALEYDSSFYHLSRQVGSQRGKRSFPGRATGPTGMWALWWATAGEGG